MSTPAAFPTQASLHMHAICSSAIAFLIVLACFSGCDTSAKNTSTHAALLGSWQIVDQRMMNADIEVIWTFSDSSIVISDGAGEIISQSPYTIDDTKVPHYITMQITDIAVEMRPGIFDIKDNELKMSFRVDGSPRPTSFEDGNLITLRKVLK